MAILTVDELREHVTTELGDDAVQRLLDAAEHAIVARAGAPGTRTELVGGGGRFIAVSRPIATVTSITETYHDDQTLLDADDYQVQTGGLLVKRLNTGTNPRHSWRDISIVYEPVDDTAVRKEVQIDLLKLETTYSPGLTRQTIGSWSEEYAANSAWSARQEREAILARLGVGLRMVVI